MEEIVLEYEPSMLLNALKNKDVKALRQIFEDYNLVDIAETLNSLDDISEYVFLFKTIPSVYTAEVFSYLDSDQREDVIQKITGDKLEDIINYLSADDITDSIQELPANLASRLISACPKELRDKVNVLLSYKEDSAGSIMTTEYIMVKEDDTRDQALARIKKDGKKAETISYLYVTDSKRVLKGSLRLKDVIFMEDNQTIKDIMEEDYVFVYTNTDQEEVASEFKKYDLNAIPVCTIDDRLVGIITVDDILDVIEEEATEDIQLMASINPLEDEYIKTSSFELAKKGVGWVVLLMLLSTFTSLIMNKFEDAMLVVPCLSIFIPMLIGTAGNAGNQSSTLITRALGVGEISVKDYIKVASKELLSALMLGLIVGIVNFGWIYFLGATKIIDLEASNVPVFKLALMVGLSIFICIILSKFLGASLPILCKLVKIDPALLAGPMLTTIVDASSIIIYFIIATKIFRLI